MPCVTGAQTLYDNFNVSSINTSLWTIYNTPTGNSSVTEAGGNATFINGAGLMTVANFADASVSGSFQFTGDNDDRFSIISRFDGTSFDPHWQDPSSGIQIQFAPSSNPSPNNPSLQINDLALGTSLASANPEIDMDTYYNFLITDSGSVINVFLGGSSNPVLSAETTASYGSTIGIFNREQLDVGGPQHETTLDYISISEVPEPSTFCLYGLSALLLVGRKLKKKFKTYQNHFPNQS